MMLKQQMLVNIAAMFCSRPSKEAKITGALPAVTLCAWMLVTTSSTRRRSARCEHARGIRQDGSALA